MRGSRQLLFTALAILLASPVFAKPAKQVESALAKLEYGTILFDFYRKDYFSALVTYESVSEKSNPLALSENGRILNGGMLLSYGIPKASEPIFEELLTVTESELTRNAAWYYLAKLFYNKYDNSNALNAIEQVNGEIPRDIHIDYHYLATLVQSDGSHLRNNLKSIEKIKKDLPQYPYFLFNTAISQLKIGEQESAILNLEKVTGYSGLGEEYAVLADRAKHGLSIIAADNNEIQQAWDILKSVRTTGLYSNRALLSYAWAAIKLKAFNAAIPALQILDTRSIAAPEVQEAKVLLAHLYEQDKLQRKALKQNIVAEKAFQEGLNKLDEARKIIAKQDVPREFIKNLETLVRETDWYASQPDVDYNNLTPFLIDLLASNGFQETLKELADLYAIEDNLVHWQLQADQHLLVLRESESKSYTDKTRELIEYSEQLKEKLQIQQEEFKLVSLSLEVKEQERFSTLFNSVSTEISLLDNTIKSIKKIQQPYTPPLYLADDINLKHERIAQSLKSTRLLIVKLEDIMRRMVNLELDKHKSRMQYYAAQSRLAKARLYDATLTTLEDARDKVQSANEEQ